MRVRFETDRQDSGWIALPARGWRRGLRFTDPAGEAAGITRVAIRQRRTSGRLVLRATRPARPVALDGATRVAVTIASGDLRWCLATTELRTTRRRTVARASVPLAHCPCPPSPPDTFGVIERRIFGRHACSVTGCHGSAPGQGGLLLVGGAAYASLVGVPSSADPSMARVAPGDPERSMLWRKLAARTLRLPGVPGGSMPIGDPGLDATELDAVRAWIAAGAPERGNVPAAEALLACDGPSSP